MIFIGKYHHDCCLLELVCCTTLFIALRVLIRNAGLNHLVPLLVSSGVWITFEIPRVLATSATPEIPVLPFKLEADAAALRGSL